MPPVTNVHRQTENVTRCGAFSAGQDPRSVEWNLMLIRRPLADAFSLARASPV